MIYLRCLGSFDVQLREKISAKIATDRARALLIYLVIESGKPHRRDALAGLFWGRKPDKAARQNLRQALSRLRKGVGGADLWQADYKQVALNTHLVQSDYHQFQALSTLPHTHHSILCPACLSQLTQAADLIQGDFLHGFYLSDASEFEDWVSITRDHIHQQAWGVYDQLVKHGMAAKQYQLAIQYSQKQLAIDPWQEGIQRRYLQALTGAKQRQKAIAHYEAYAAMLAAEIQAEPQPETVALIARIRDNTQHELMGSLRHFPAQLTPFVGRLDEREAVVALLHQSDCRMVTLLGAGGVGKTRLAIEIAHHLSGEQFAGGIYFVSLVTATTAYDAVAILHRALALPTQGKDIEAQLFSYLRNKRLLLLLDNLEQLAGKLRFLSRLLQNASGVKILATSRDVIGISAEHRYPVHGIDNLKEASSILWSAIRRIIPNFDLSATNIAIGAQICEQLHGVPLALELAATWISTLDLDSIREEIAEAYSFLESPLLDTPDRHRSLGAIFEHSWQLLQPKRQEVLANVSIFRGGLNMTAARAVLGSNVHDLRRLVEQSLLIKVADSANKTRYTLHELVRQFAALKRSPAQTNTIRHTHSHYYLSLIASYEKQLVRIDALTASKIIADDLDNITSAWQWAVTNHLIDQLNASVIAMMRFYRLTGRYSQGKKLFSETISRLDQKTDATLLAHLHSSVATFCMWQTQYDDSIAAAKRAFEFASFTKNEVLIAESLCFWGRALRAKGDYRLAIPKLQQGLTACNGVETSASRAQILTNLSIISAFGIAPAAATELAEMGLEAVRLSGDKFVEAHVLNILTFARTQTCHTKQAWSLSDEGLGLSRQLGNRLNEALALMMRARIDIALGHYKRANRNLITSREIYKSIGNQVGVLLTLTQLTRSFIEVGDLEAALKYCNEAIFMAKTSKTAFHHLHMSVLRGSILCGADRLDEARKAFEATEALRIAPEFPIQLQYLVQFGLANIAFKAGNMASALGYISVRIDELLADSTLAHAGSHRCLLAYRILQANGDGRDSKILQLGYDLLMKYASHTEDDKQRQAFLERVPDNRKLLATWHAVFATENSDEIGPV